MQSKIRANLIKYFKSSPRPVALHYKSFDVFFIPLVRDIAYSVPWRVLGKGHIGNYTAWSIFIMLMVMSNDCRIGQGH